MLCQHIRVQHVTGRKNLPDAFAQYLSTQPRQQVLVRGGSQVALKPFLYPRVGMEIHRETIVPHPADLNNDLRMVMSEAITYLAGWQQGGNPIGYAIRAAYLWQNGERYTYDSRVAPPLCWILGL